MGHQSAAYEDVGGNDCWSAGPQFELVSCTFGDVAGKTRIALVGNSHAGQWLPTLEAVSGTEDLQITTYLASRCAFADVDQNLPTTESMRACRSWVESVSKAVVNGDFDAVVLTNRMSVSAKEADGPAANVEAYRQGYASVLMTLAHRNVPLLVLRDTPAPGDAGLESASDCVAEHLEDLGVCSGPRSEWEPVEPMQAAFEDVRPPGSRFVAANDAICQLETCSTVVGGVIVYSDGSHLTAIYSRTLAPVISRPLREVIRN